MNTWSVVCISRKCCGKKFMKFEGKLVFTRSMVLANQHFEKCDVKFWTLIDPFPDSDRITVSQHFEFYCIFCF